MKTAVEVPGAAVGPPGSALEVPETRRRRRRRIASLAAWNGLVLFGAVGLFFLTEDPIWRTIPVVLAVGVSIIAWYPSRRSGPQK